MLAELNVRRSVLSVAGITDNGCYNSNLLLVETERAMMQAADEVIIVADSTKLGKTSLVHLCDLGDIGTLVIDPQIPEDWRSKLVASGVRIVVAGQTDNT
jgi:DeoR/GlpR family transcriptional regulator of sugar metabolism